MSKNTGRIVRWAVTVAIALAVGIPMVNARQNPVAPLQPADTVQAPAQKPAPVVIKVSAKKYEYDPATITVEKGKPVRLEITATDRNHGFEIKDLKLKVNLEKGKMQPLEFTPGTVGEFEIKCSDFCGLGHGGMKAKLVVTAPKL